MVYYNNNFKSHKDLIKKRTNIINNIFKLVNNPIINTKKEFIDNKWKLIITVET